MTEPTELPKQTLYGCTQCFKRFNLGADDEKVCPECSSDKVIEDNLFTVPRKHAMYSCTCGGFFFKIAMDTENNMYFKCVKCGVNHHLSDMQ